MLPVVGIICALLPVVEGAVTTASPPPGALTPGPSYYDKTNMKYDYGEALGLSILFYDAQRAGKLPANNPIAWRGDSVLYDYDDDGHDLTGGWFDAGDHVKFNFPMSFSTWVLNWGLLEFTDAYRSSGELEMMCDMIKWPLEYLLKCWRPDEQILYAQVGDPDLDHARWASPETMNMSRPAYQVNLTCPGSDLAADMTSAFASGYLVFFSICEQKDFAQKLLDGAEMLYGFAKSNRGLFSDCVTNGYTSSGDTDELTAAAVWMYKATGKPSFLTDAEGFYNPDTPWGFDWDHKGPGANLLLYKETENQIYLNATQRFMTQAMHVGDIPYTPCGLIYRNRWGSCRHAANFAFIALMAAQYGIEPMEYKVWALSQINYILGDNNYNMSYEVGFGNKYPTHYHHRASSCMQLILDCDIENPDDNPNLLYGALVGGPDENDVYEDVRSDYVHNEVAVDYNAGFQSALAALVHFSNAKSLPESPPRKC